EAGAEEILEVGAGRILALERRRRLIRQRARAEIRAVEIQEVDRTGRREFRHTPRPPGNAHRRAVDTSARALKSPTNQLQGPTPPPTTRGLCPVELSCLARACLSPGLPYREAQCSLFSARADSKSNYKASMIAGECCGNHHLPH